MTLSSEMPLWEALLSSIAGREGLMHPSAANTIEEDLSLKKCAWLRRDNK